MRASLMRSSKPLRVVSDILNLLLIGCRILTLIDRGQRAHYPRHLQNLGRHHHSITPWELRTTSDKPMDKGHSAARPCRISGFRMCTLCHPGDLKTTSSNVKTSENITTQNGKETGILVKQESAGKPAHDVMNCHR